MAGAVEVRYIGDEDVRKSIDYEMMNDECSMRIERGADSASC
jgi:hypothetical protein